MGSSQSKGKAAAPATKAATGNASAEDLSKKVYIGVDLGGTNAKAAVVDQEGKMLKRADIPLTDKVRNESGCVRLSLL